MFKKLLLLGTIVLAQSLGELCDTNGCISFSVVAGTGCAWMCNYCASQLGTSNYYFTSPVCTYESGGCVGSPISGVQYTCCSTQI